MCRWIIAFVNCVCATLHSAFHVQTLTSAIHFISFSCISAIPFIQLALICIVLHVWYICSVSVFYMFRICVSAELKSFSS